MEPNTILDVKELKKLNSRLAHSSQQAIRDVAMNDLEDMLIHKKKWVDTSEQNNTKEQRQINNRSLNIIWEGLFYCFWHSDKSVYQRDLAIKIAALTEKLESLDKQKRWIKAFFFIFNHHWDKVDNFRIDKYLLLMRHQMQQILKIVKKQQYTPEIINWYHSLMNKLFDGSDQLIKNGIPLQICDVFIPELNKCDGQNISLENISKLLQPFLSCMQQSSNQVIIDRALDSVFMPILVNNVTPEEKSDDESPEDHDYNVPQEGKRIDGGRMNPKTLKEVTQIIDTKYVFPAFNILMFAQNELLNAAKDPKVTKEVNREQLYELYDKALGLEPKPDRPDLTFSQIMNINRARSFVTMKMQKRQKMRESKQQGKMYSKLSKMLSQQLIDKYGMPGDDDVGGPMEIPELPSEELEKWNKDSIEKELLEKEEVSANNILKNGKRRREESKIQSPYDDDEPSKQEDKVIQIENKQIKKKKKKRAKVAVAEDSTQQTNQVDQKKVHFGKPSFREFHSYGKVATKTLPDSHEIKGSPFKSLLKKVSTVGNKYKKSVQIK